MTKRAITFRQYLSRRGYDLRKSPGAFLGRMFLSAWAEPGFHRFWRVWNPLYGYFLFHLYRLLGGNRHKVPATLTVFVVCGFAMHDLPVILLTSRIQLTVTVAFLAFGLAALSSQAVARSWGLSRWPKWLHVLLNLGLIVAGLLFGAWVQVRLVT